ncbi:MAG: metallophosphoesterase family protein [Conexibacter sp.]
MSLRILHTADWHLGDRLGGLDRLPDQLERLGELIAHAEARRADALLVCGDVLEEQRSGRLATIVSRLGELLAPSVERGMQCLFLAGNHDSSHTFELLSGVQRLLGEPHAARVRFVSRPALVPLSGPGGGTAAAVVALPYPSAAAYALPGDLRSVEEKRAALSEAVAASMETLSARAAREHPGVPQLMAGHFLLRHVDAPTGLREVPESEDVHVEAEALDRFAYVALGHVHQPLALAEHVRYSGALDRVDFAEAGEARQVVLVELEEEGGRAIEALPLGTTPMERYDVGSLGELAERARALADPARTIVKLALRLERADVASLWLAEARRSFPRLFAPIELIRLDEPDPPVLTGEIEPRSPRETVRAFLEDQLADDPDRATLLELAEQLLGEEGLLGR